MSVTKIKPNPFLSEPLLKRSERLSKNAILLMRLISKKVKIALKFGLQMFPEILN